MRIDETYFFDTRHEALVPGRYVMPAVRDNGHGDFHEHNGEIFEPFITSKPPDVGSGIGLSMVVGFMKQSGGTVQAYSEFEQRQDNQAEFSSYKCATF